MLRKTAVFIVICILAFSCGNQNKFLPILQDGKWGYIDKKGRIVIEPQLDVTYAGFFSDGLAAVNIGSKWGFINEKGDMVISPQYDGTGGFRKGFAVAELRDKLGFINKSGQIKPKVRIVRIFTLWVKALYGLL